MSEVSTSLWNTSQSPLWKEKDGGDVDGGDDGDAVDGDDGDDGGNGDSPVTMPFIDDFNVTYLLIKYISFHNFSGIFM